MPYYYNRHTTFIKYTDNVSHRVNWLLFSRDQSSPETWGTWGRFPAFCPHKRRSLRTASEVCRSLCSVCSWPEPAGCTDGSAQTPDKCSALAARCQTDQLKTDTYEGCKIGEISAFRNARKTNYMQQEVTHLKLTLASWLYAPSSPDGKSREETWWFRLGIKNEKKIQVQLKVLKGLSLPKN